MEAQKEVALSRKKTNEIIGQAKKEGEAKKDEIMVCANDEANSKIAEAKSIIEKDKIKEIIEINNDIANAALDWSSKILKREISSSDNDKIINDFINSLDKDK